MCQPTPQDREQVIRMLFQDIEMAKIVNERQAREMHAQALRFQGQSVAYAFCGLGLGMIISAIIFALEEEKKQKPTVVNV